MSALAEFVEQRLAEQRLPPAVQRTYQTILGLSEAIRRDGETDDWISWLTGSSVALKIGEYVLGADPASDAERISDHLRAALARTWDEHPDYDPAWRELAPNPPNESS